MKKGIRQYLRPLWRILVNVFLAGIILLLLFTMKNPEGTKAQVYVLARDVMKKSLDIKTFNWYVIDGERFQVKYQPVDAPIARLVLETAEDSFEPVSQMLGYIPEEAVPILIYPTKASLNKSFGWDAAVNAMGVYWAGSIRILSPLDWVEDEVRITEIFEKKGPLAHEYAHLLVDYRTNGNYPRWLTEGIAQYVERELTGFVLADAKEKSGLWYSFQEMDGGFDLLPDQEWAYIQSLLAVDYIVETAGFDRVLDLLDELAKGKKISAAMDDIFGKDLVFFENELKTWVNKLKEEEKSD